MASSNALLKKSGFDLTRNSIFCCKWQNYFSIFKKQVAEHEQLIFDTRSLKTQNVQICRCVNLLCFCNYKSFFLSSKCLPQKRRSTSMALWHQADWHTNLPQVHDLIMYELEVQVIVSLESYWVLFILGSYWVLTLDTCHILL